jgi:Ca-activated chloride channel family protein
MDSSRDMGSYTRFATQAEVRAPLSSSFSAIKSIIQGENASGATNLSGGLSLAASTLQNDSSREKLILVVSDGFHNVGQTSPVAVAAALKQAGYRIFSIGFSQAADKVTLRQLASPGDYYSADNSAELQAAFTKIADATCR